MLRQLHTVGSEAHRSHIVGNSDGERKSCETQDKRNEYEVVDLHLPSKK